MYGRRRTALLALALALTAGGCRSKAYKAAGNEAVYDQIMPAKAYPAARTAIRRAIQNDEDEPRLWMKLARVELLLDNPVAAAAAFQTALDLQPDNVEALQNLAVIHVRVGRFQQAKQFVRPLSLLQPDNPVVELVNGAIAVSEKRFDAAYKTADKLIADYPDANEGHVLKARALNESGRPAEATALLARRATDRPTDVDLWRQLLQLQRLTGDDIGAQRTILQLAEQLPEDPVYAVLAARALHARGKPLAAEQAIRAATAKFAGDVAVTRAIARYWRDTAPRNTALREIGALAAKADARGKQALAAILIDLGDGAGALALIGPQTGAVTAGNIEPRILQARALRAAGRTAEAQARVDEVLRLDSSNFGALLIRAELALARRDYPAALADAQLAASSDPENERAALTVARVYAASGNAVMAAQAFGGAVRHFPNSVTAMRAYADWLVSRRRADEAVALAREYNRRHSGDFAARDAYRAVCRAVDRACAPVIAS